MLTELKRFSPRRTAISLRTVWPFNAIYKSICRIKTVSSFHTSVFERRAFGILGVSLLTYLLLATSATAQAAVGADAKPADQPPVGNGLPTPSD
jgi:hypothetical protein